MNRLARGALAAAIGLALSTGAMGQALSKEEYAARKDGIAAELAAAETVCDTLAGNSKDICVAQADGREGIALAVLAQEHEPSADGAFDVRMARAKAAFDVAIQKCDDKSGDIKDVCVKQAEADDIAARADAKAQLTTATANADADEVSADARSAAAEESLDARQEASEEKRDASYAVAKEKCNALSGDTKDDCVAAARARFGKS